MGVDQREHYSLASWLPVIRPGRGGNRHGAGNPRETDAASSDEHRGQAKPTEQVSQYECVLSQRVTYHGGDRFQQIRSGRLDARR